MYVYTVHIYSTVLQCMYSTERAPHHVTKINLNFLPLKIQKFIAVMNGWPSLFGYEPFFSTICVGHSTKFTEEKFHVCQHVHTVSSGNELRPNQNAQIS